jgi:hypothetical protein
MKPAIRHQFETELEHARADIAANQLEAAWTALQRAHILGQTDPIAHAVAHWTMLKLAWKQADAKEIVGQLVQAGLAAPLTLMTGRSRALRRGRVQGDRRQTFIIPEDLQQLLDQNNDND